MTKQEFMAMSLPYGLKIFRTNKDRVVTLCELGIYTSGKNYTDVVENYELMSTIEIDKPILHPLSDLTKPIEHGGETFVPIKKFARQDQKDIEISIVESSFIELLSFYIIQKLIEWHFDIAGIIEKGEAIDINTLETNPYK